MNGTASPINVAVADQRRFIIATGAIVFIGWLGDFLFWNTLPGISLGVFATITGCLLLIVGQRTPAALTALALLCASAIQSGIEVCFSNVACIVVLLIVLFGEATFGAIGSRWPRWSEALAKLCSGPLRWKDFTHTWAKTGFVHSGREHLRGPSLGRMAAVAAPALVVAIVFSFFLSSGNAILAELFSRIGTRIQAWLLEISFARTFLWLIWMTLGVSFFWPGSPTQEPRWWTRAIPLWNRPDATIAKWQSILLLGVVNALFFAANTIDVIYLWSAHSLPSGVNHSVFVHEGVQSLITAVILAAIILAIVFQQQPAVARTPLLRVLALVWIAQNVVLICGVLKRLELYVEAFQLSELRVYVACFLALVTVGFLLLARHVWSGMQLGKLLFQNTFSTFVLFFAVQFCDVGTWVANWNVSHWENHRGIAIDLDYLVSLGPRGWPALSQVSRSTRDREIAAQAESKLRQSAARLRTEPNKRDWRSFQARRDLRANALLQNWAPQNHP